MKHLNNFAVRMGLGARGAVLVLIVTLTVGAGIASAEFLRQTGETGWGWGYGYGYGYGFGWDGGTFAGYRQGGNPDPSVNDYGYGYGYLPEGYNSGDDTYDVDGSDMANLIRTGILKPNGSDITNTDEVTFKKEVTITFGNNTVTIPAGTTMTAAGGTDFSELSGTDSVVTNDVPGNPEGAVQFGLPALGLVLDPPITIRIEVGTKFNGKTLKVYHKPPGGDWEVLAECTVAGGFCEFETSELSSFAASSSSGGSSGGYLPGYGPFATPPALGLYGTPANLAAHGLHEGDVISASDGDPDVYIVNAWGFRRLFLNPVIFGFYGHLGGWQVVKHVPGATRDAFPASGLFRNCETDDQKVYALEVTGEDTGFLHWVDVTGDQAAQQDPEFFHKVFCINTKEFDWYPKSPTPYMRLSDLPKYQR